MLCFVDELVASQFTLVRTEVSAGSRYSKGILDAYALSDVLFGDVFCRGEYVWLRISTKAKAAAYRENYESSTR